MSLYQCDKCQEVFKESDAHHRLCSPATRYEPAEWERFCPECGSDYVSDFTKPAFACECGNLFEDTIKVYRDGYTIDACPACFGEDFTQDYDYMEVTDK